MTHIRIMSSHKPIILYMGGLILGINTWYRFFCFFKLFSMVSKGLISVCFILTPLGVPDRPYFPADLLRFFRSGLGLEEEEKGSASASGQIRTLGDE